MSTLSTVTTVALASTICFPFLGALILIVLPLKSEKNSAWVAISMTWLSSLASIVGIVIWMFGGFKTIQTHQLIAVTSGVYHFNLGLTMNLAAAAFLFLVEFTSGMVIRFSRVYMHREPGFRRFFAVVLMFQGAMALLTLASNLDLLFCGWELAGLASFLLIAFYHERKSSVRNALKTFSIYRVADVGMLLGAFLEHTSSSTVVGLLLLLGAAGKSAQFPFSFWIVRAMEGPTPSSALFYGALSVHAGAYLLLRTYSIWGGITSVRICVGLLGLTTAILCSMFSRVRHTIKGQIGYASATQVGLIFVELALGLKALALFHMVSNALFRCYQLLVSPSAIAYLLRQQSSSETARPSEEHSLFQRLLTREARSSIYVFAISEGFLEDAIRNIFWTPLKKTGTLLIKIQGPVMWAALGLGAVGLIVTSHTPYLPPLLALGSALFIIAVTCSILALDSPDPLKTLAYLGASCLAATLAVYVISKGLVSFPGFEYLTGIALSCCVTALGIKSVFQKKISRATSLVESHPTATWIALGGALGIAGFPLLPTFFGEDILLNAAFQVHPIFAFALSSLFALNGYLAVRSFAFTFFGSKEQITIKQV